LIDSQIKKLLGFKPDTPDEEVLEKWKNAISFACKPCWELKYCPYGPFVEQSPLLPSLRKDAIEHNEYLIELLSTGSFPDGSPLDDERRIFFEREVEVLDPQQYPESIPKDIVDMQCNVFGHICPVIFVGENFTETAEIRRRGRYIPFKIKMRVIRRDNYTCQICEKHLRDDEVEFDHIIPVSKGGSTEEDNIQLTCYECNRDKSNRVEM